MPSLTEWINAVWPLYGRFVIAYIVVGLISWFAEMKTSGVLKAFGEAWNDKDTNNFMLVWLSIPVILGSMVFCTALWLPANTVRDLHLILEGGWGDDIEESETS